MRRKPPSWQTFTRRLDWNLIKVYHQIVQSQGISNAAKVLLRKQPAVSASLRQLEELLQVRLCERGPAGFKLTAEGEKLYELAEKMVKLLRAAPDDINKVLGEITGVLDICLISNLVLPILNQGFQVFATQNPRMHLKISIFPWQEAVHRVLEAQTDVAVVYQRVRNAELDYQWLCRETQYLYCGPSHRLYGQTVSDPLSLRDEPFVLTGLDEAEEVAGFRLRYGLGNNVSAISEDLSEVRRLINAGIGIGFLPAANLSGPADQTGLWQLLVNSLDLPTYNLWVVARHAHKRSPAADRFISTMAGLIHAEEQVRSIRRQSG
jgi:DNA-binding transcriptional LysR family regulator